MPLLALLPLLAPGHETEIRSWTEALMPVALVAGAIAAIVFAGRYLLNPFFRRLADTGSREVMTASALLVVLGAALADAKRGHVDGARGVPRRPDARGIEFPP